jgi:hypothetical protein
MLVTFATCWYALHSKFQVSTYLNWMQYLLRKNSHYYLVIFTDADGAQLLQDHFPLHSHLQIIQKPIEQWYNYRYKDHWIKNHQKNLLLNDRTEWALNMLWAEKTHFVNEARVQQYFPPTEFYGWCDIGYFREGPCSASFCSNLQSLNKNKIYYAYVCPQWQLQQLEAIVKDKNAHGLPTQPIPANQNSIAGGFFIAHQSKIAGWQQKFDEKLALYFQHEYLVKDDQIIIVDCVFSEPHRFELIQETDPKQNPWFYFRRWLGGNFAAPQAHPIMG